ncbi:MAG: hypothetical protein JNJ83_24930 [Verrucomicrobiaceae bacterium]|nr:hypothetical protein [Verrucomicrobiaceae bacterium]
MEPTNSAKINISGPSSALKLQLLDGLDVALDGELVLGRREITRRDQTKKFTGLWASPTGSEEVVYTCVRDGLFDGPQWSQTIAGTIQWLTNWDDGRVIGPRIYWNEDGSLSSFELLFEDGAFVENGMKSALFSGKNRGFWKLDTLKNPQLHTIPPQVIAVGMTAQ